MTTQIHEEVDRPQTDEAEMNLPAQDRGRPYRDAEGGAELPGETHQQTPKTTDPPGGDEIKL